VLFPANAVEKKMDKYIIAITTLTLMSCFSNGSAALTITNGTAESLKVTVEKWQRRINPGDSATFTPTKPPVLLQFELRNYFIPCEAGTNDFVLVENAKCFVNGVETGESQLRM